MKTFDLIKNAYILQSGESSAQEPAVQGLIAKARGLSISRSIMYTASYFLAKRDPISKSFLTERPAPTLKEALSSASQLTRNLNNRFGRSGLVILNADDEEFLKTMARIPEPYFKNTLMGFEGYIRPIKKAHESALIGALQDSLAKLGRLVLHYGASLDTFIRSGHGDQYNSYSRVAFSHNIMTNDEPVAYFLNNKEQYGVSVINLCEKGGNKASNIHSFPFAQTLSEQKWFYIFSHELGHCLTPLPDYKAIEGECLADHQMSKGWILECFADTFSACLCAKLTGNWDLLRTTILPLRAYAENEHNTFSVLEPLLKEDPMLFMQVDESRLFEVVDGLTRRNVQAYLDKGLVSQDHAASRYAASLMRGDAEHAVSDLDPETYRNLLNRTQSVIDAVAIESVASERVDIKALDAIVTWVSKIGQEKVAAQLSQARTLGKEGMKSHLLSFASKDSLHLANRVASNEFQLADYVQGLKDDSPMNASPDGGLEMAEIGMEYEKEVYCPRQ
ncbi:hypothetical protein P5704_026085 (plasmid) [Pseudomonas sp. FeN3W]|nr:hypothetical protein P5704_026085 [Pseudomonas sp. FeN3W]